MKLFNRIGIGSLSIRNLNPFIAAICYVVRNYALIEINNTIFQDFKWNQNPLFFTLLMFLGEILIGLIELFSIDWMKKSTYDPTENLKRIIKTPFRIIHPQKQSKKSLLIVIFGLCVIEAFCFYLLNILNNLSPTSNNLQIEIKGFKLVFDSVICYFLLNYRIFPHHYLSMIILISGMTIMTAQEILMQEYDVYLPFIFFGHSLLLSIRDSIEKAIMHNKFIGAVRILFYRGVFGFALMAFIAIIVRLGCPDNGIPYFCEKIDIAIGYMVKGLLPLFFFIYFIAGAVYNLMATLTKQDFNPAYMAVADYFCAIIWMIVSVFILGAKRHASLILIIVGYFMITIGCFLYNELIIFYCFNLHWNTKKEIMKRSDEEGIQVMEAELV